MSDYNFYHNPSSNASFTVSFSGNTFTLTTASTFAVGDIVHLPVTDKTGVFGYCINGGAKQFRYDSEIYGSFSGSDTITGCRVWDASVDLLFDDVDTYRIAVEAEIGLYSNSYKKYSSSIDYTLIANNKRRQFFNDTQYKSVKNLILANEVVFSDACKEYAYGVGFAGNDFDTLNNRFKSSLEFNIATR